MIKRLSFCLILCFLYTGTFSQTKYWVKFTDKNGTPYSISSPSAFLSSKSIARRTAYNIQLDASDLPVNPSYMNQVGSVSTASIIYASKWLNGVVVALSDTNSLNTIKSFSFVSSTGIVNRYKVEISEPEEISQASEKPTASTATVSYYGKSEKQVKQLGVDCSHTKGYRGQGMTIAVLDAGFQNVDINPVYDSIRARGGILGTRDFVSGGTSVYEDHFHGAAVFSTMAALKPNVLVGTAPLADYWLLRTEDAATEKIIEEYNWIRGAEFADSVGADVLTTSLGYTEFDNPAQNHTFAQLNGKTAPMSIAATMAARKGMLVLNAAGNGNGGPWPKIGIPADADSIITVGAVDSMGVVAGFSSIGPTADGRIKPELVSRGVKTWVSISPNAVPVMGDGTSYATPVMAGAVTCFWQMNKNLKNFEVIEKLKQSASNKASPNNSIGWGVPVICTGAQEYVPVGGCSFEFNVYPNPTSDKVIIKWGTVECDLNIRVISMLGKVMRTYNSTSGKEFVELDLSDLSTGIYFINIAGSQGTINKKLIMR